MALRRTFYMAQYLELSDRRCKRDYSNCFTMEVKDGAAILSFDHAKDGFNRLKGMEGFEIAGDDKVFYPAEAEVYNNLQIKVKSDKVKNPVAVRYCFRDFKPGNVANLRELPMYPFRTDNWE